MKKKAKICITVLLVNVAIILSLAFFVPFSSIKSLPDNMFCNFEAIENINKNKIFGNFVSAKYKNNVEVSTSGENFIKVDLKLLNLITLKTFNAVNTSGSTLFAGGDIVGFALKGKGVVVISGGEVETENGIVCTTQHSDIKKGDIILKIEGEDVKSVADICRVANAEKNKDRSLSLILQRGDKQIETTIINALDKNSKLYKLGLWVKDDVSGIGTLTYIAKDSGRFGALGHAISDNDTKTIYNINSGEMYPCTVIGLKKGAKGRAGELRGLFMQGKSNKIGNVDKNCESGVFGFVCTNKHIEAGKDEFEIGGRLFAKPGKAYIRTAIDGNLKKDYEIEIVKTNYQSSSNEKSMIIRVTDKALINKTGGIIQGMSGSPIIQNGKIIGAVTHVFLNDPTKGFGVYLDWMINQ